MTPALHQTHEVPEAEWSGSAVQVWHVGGGLLRGHEQGGAAVGPARRPAKTAPSIGELIALANALRSGSLNSAQAELVRALREGLGQLETVKVQKTMNIAEILASVEVL